MSEKVFAKGLYAKAKNEKAPAFVKGSLSIKVEDFILEFNIIWIAYIEHS